MNEIAIDASDVIQIAILYVVIYAILKSAKGSRFGQALMGFGILSAALLEKEAVDGRDVEALLREPTEGADAAPPAEEVEGQCK